MVFCPRPSQLRSTQLTDGPIIFATSYLLPRRPFLPHPDFLRLLRRRSPVFIARDLNARHPTLGYRLTNQIGRELVAYLRRQTAKHIGPHFPTYYGPLSATSPDIVLSNAANFLYHSLTPGPLTTSDHIPIILGISTSPIPIYVPKSFAFDRTDWDAFNGDDSLQMADLPDVSRATLDDIDAALDSWMTTVKLAADRHIPKTAHRTPAYCRPSRLTQMTRFQFQALRAQAERAGWTYDNYRRYIILRLTLQDARRVESLQYWGR
ncbi:hypothetical protein GWK47_053682 [Chionoecetes opilio]|uniref:Endonuclease/exonuclease/phosphatase domain-containing protein n=1 Tax=Chionoecetes opilio TaxID=41210 RepID=A0A8J5C8Y6_CHIOP|nr:hypothetical protein GWK47_053682 [Chionoecetes opilio]